MRLFHYKKSIPFTQRQQKGWVEVEVEVEVEAEISIMELNRNLNLDLDLNLYPYYFKGDSGSFDNQIVSL
jgi:hypothetical protein